MIISLDLILNLSSLQNSQSPPSISVFPPYQLEVFIVDWKQLGMEAGSLFNCV